jgi:hypothetical protein
MIGAWRGRQLEETVAQEVNRQLIDELKGIWDKGVKDGKQGEFVNIATLDPKTDDKILIEAASLVPAQTIAYTKEVFGPGVLMVRRDMLLDTFGARQASVGDLFSGNTRWNPKVAREFEKVITGMFGMWGKDAFTTLVGSEQNIQDVVANVKQTIVVKSVIVPVANMVSNMVALMNRGVPLRVIIHGVGAKTAEINSYVKRRQREIDLGADLRAAEGKNDTGTALKLENQIQSIRDSYKRMSIWPLIEAGEFSAISSGQVTAEDLALSDGKWSNFIEKKVNDLQEPFKTMARYGLITKDTALFQGLARAVQYGDFVAKAVLYDDPSGACGTDHPRVCGGHPPCWWKPRHALGSSPRVRGTLEPVQTGQCLARIIPACAGDTSNSIPPKTVLPDHPRVCGGHDSIPPLPPTQDGSSPRVRGTRMLI